MPTRAVTAPTPASRLAVWAAACAVAAVVGCRSSDGGGWLRRGGDGGSNAGIARTDPLLGGARIPPQDLPIPGRDSYGSRQTRDPLLGSPTGRDDSATKATQQNTDKPKSTKGDSARGEPWRPGLEATNGALAAGLRVDDATLSIGDRRPVVVPVSNPVRLQPRANPAASTAGIEAYTDALRRLGAKWTPPEREGSLYVMRAEVPTANGNGVLRKYEGAGDTAAAAAAQLVEQIRGER